MLPKFKKSQSKPHPRSGSGSDDPTAVNTTETGVWTEADTTHKKSRPNGRRWERPDCEMGRDSKARAAEQCRKHGLVPPPPSSHQGRVLVLRFLLLRHVLKASVFQEQGRPPRAVESISPDVNGSRYRQLQGVGLLWVHHTDFLMR